MERGLGDIGRDAPAPQAAPPGSELGPIDEMNRSLQENPDPTHRYVQLATVRPDGTPACRTVVFRGFMADAVAGLPSCALQFTTDTLSEKAAELAANSAAEACWWFPTSQEQYRVQGRLRLITDALSEEAGEEEAALAKARRVMWAKMSPRARLSWLWPAPKSERPADATTEQDEADYSPVLPPESEPAGRYPVTEGDPDSVENTGVPLPRFALLLLVPTAVDHFQLAGFPQRRAIYTLRDPETAPSLLGPDAWQRTWVSP